MPRFPDSVDCRVVSWGETIRRGTGYLNLTKFTSFQWYCPAWKHSGRLQHSWPTNSRSSLRLMPIESVIPSSHLILCRPLLLLPPIPPTIRVFSHESTLHMRWPKYWSFSLSIIPSKEIPGLISFRMDWLDLPAVQGTLKSLLQQKQNLNQNILYVTVKRLNKDQKMDSVAPSDQLWKLQDSIAMNS